MPAGESAKPDAGAPSSTPLTSRQQAIECSGNEMCLKTT